MIKLLPKHTLPKDKLKLRLKLLVDIIKDALEKFELTEEMNTYDDALMDELLHSLAKSISTLREAHMMLENENLLSSVIFNMSQHKIHSPGIFHYATIEETSHLSNVETLRLVKCEMFQRLQTFILMYEQLLPSINKSALSVLNAILETTAYYLFVACHDNGSSNFVNTLLYDKIMYFDYKNHVSSDQETIIFPTGQKIIIIYHCDGQKRAVKEFVDEYCLNLEAHYFNDLDKGIMSVKANMALFLENTDSEFADQLVCNNIQCFANIMQEHALCEFSDNIFQFDGTYNLDTIFEFLAAV